MLLKSLFLVYLALLLNGPTTAWGQMSISGISIAADSSEFDNETNTLLLNGNVQVIYNGYYLSCDKAVLHRLTKQIQASGRVVLQTTTTYMEAQN